MRSRTHGHKGELHPEVPRQQMGHLDVESDEVALGVEIGKGQIVWQIADAQEFMCLNVLQARRLGCREWGLRAAPRYTPSPHLESAAVASRQ